MDHLSIIVQIEDNVNITDEDLEDPNGNIFVTCNAKNTSVKNNYPGYKGKVNLLDFKTLQLDLIKETPRANKITYKMYFDLVTLTSEDFFLVELSNMMDEFLLQRCDVCLIRFAAHRMWNLTFLYKTLITEVNKRLVRLNATVNSIRVDYKDILKNRTSDMLNCDQNSPRRNYYCRHRTQYCNNTFKSTQELLYWLLNGNRSKWNNAKGHVFLELKFLIRDEEHKTFTLKFTLFDVYLNKMDNADCFKWKTFIEQLGVSVDSKFKHSPLTSMLNSHLETNNTQCERTRFFFDVPIDENNVTPTVTLLRMADTIFKRRYKINANLKKNRRTNNIEDGSKENHTKQKNETPKSEADINSQTFHVDTKCESKEKRNEIAQSQFERNDLYCLSFWYQGIDEKFASVRSAMQSYLEQYYGVEVAQMCNDIKIMCRNIKNTTEGKDAKDFMVNVARNNYNITEVYNNYVSKYLDFKKLIDDIEHSKFSEFLKIYLETRYYELSDDVLKFKIRKLILLSDIMNYEQSALHFRK